MQFNSAEDRTRVTRLLTSKQVFRKAPFKLLDIGARDGVKLHWESFNPDLHVIGFEPDPTEANRLSDLQGNYRKEILRFGLAGETGRRQFHVHNNPSSSSLNREDPNYLNRLTLREAFEIVSTPTIEVKKIDDIRGDLGDVDFVDIDTEGAELEIFRGGETLMRDSRLLGVFTEVRFNEGFNTPLFAEVDMFLRGCGFTLYDLDYYHESRRALPYPLWSDARHDMDPSVKIFGVTTLGQAVVGNVLYVKDPIGKKLDMPLDKLLKLICIFELYGQNDSAAELILAHKAKIDPIVPHGELLDLLASEMGARHSFSYSEYMARYMKHDDIFRPAKPVPERRPTWSEKLRYLFR